MTYCAARPASSNCAGSRRAHRQCRRCASHRAAIDRENPRLNAFIDLDDSAFAAAAASAARRREGNVIGRLDGLTVAVKDNLDVAGLATRAGLPGRRRIATEDAVAVARLRAAGAVILGKTQLDEGALGTMTANPHTGPRRIRRGSATPPAARPAVRPRRWPRVSRRSRSARTRSDRCGFRRVTAAYTA